MNDLELEDIESRLYSQIYHRTNDEPEENFTHEADNLNKTPIVMKTQKARYFAPWKQGPRFQNVPHKKPNVLGCPRTPPVHNNYEENEGFYSKSCRTSYKPDISINQVVVVSPKSPIVCMTAKALRKAKAREKYREKRRQRRGGERSAANKEVREVTPKQVSVISLTDSEDDSCILINDSWPVLSIEDSDEEKNSSESKKNDPKDGNITSKSDQTLSDDVIFVEPVIPQVEIIDIDEESESNLQKENQPSNKEKQLHQERKELLSTPDSNDFMNTSGVELNQRNFNFSLHGSDFNSGDFLKPNNPTDTCETESSSSTTDVNTANLMKSIVFNEVEFPKDDLFAGNNLENFGNLITPSRKGAKPPAAQSPLAYLTNIQNENVYSSVSSESDFEESQTNVYSAVSSESDFEESQTNRQKTKTLPELSHFNVSPEKHKESKQGKQKGKLKKKKKKKSLTENITLEAENETPEFRTDEDTRRKKRRSELLDSNNESVDTPSRKRVKNKKKKDNTQSQGDNTPASTDAENRNIEAQDGGRVKNKKNKNDGATIEVVEEIDCNSTDALTTPKTKNKKKKTENTDVHLREILSPSLGKTDDGTEEDTKISNNSTETLQKISKIENKKKKTDATEPQGTEKAPNSVENIDKPQHFIRVVNENELLPVAISDKSDSRKTDHSSATTLETTDTIKHQSFGAQKGNSSKSEPVSLFEGLTVIDETSCSVDIQVLTSDSDSALSSLTEEHAIEINIDKSPAKPAPSSEESVMDLNNCSVKDIQLAMSNDPKLWEILDSDRMPPARSNKGRRCNKCKELGHGALRCTNKVYPKCKLCGEGGHHEPRCPNKLCTQCGQKSNYLTNYCSTCFKYRHFQCHLCSMVGHIAEKCPDLWRRYYLTTSEGPPITYDGPVLKNHDELWCSGCAQNGHLEHECDFFKSLYPSVIPYIKSYADIYDNCVNSQRLNQFVPPQLNYALNVNPNMMMQQQNFYPGFDSGYVQNYCPPINSQVRGSCFDLMYLNNQQNFFVGDPNDIYVYNRNGAPPHNRQSSSPQRFMAPPDVAPPGTHHAILPPTIQNPRPQRCVAPRNVGPPVPQQRVSARQNSNPQRFEMPLPTYISLDTGVSAPSGTLNGMPSRNSRYFKLQMRRHNSIFFSSSTAALRHFLCAELQRLTKLDYMSNKVTKEIRKRQVPKRAEDKDEYYQTLNMLLFGIFNLVDGKMHLDKLKQFKKERLKTKVTNVTRQQLFRSYSYIFGCGPHDGIDYFDLLRRI